MRIVQDNAKNYTRKVLKDIDKNGVSPSLQELAKPMLESCRDRTSFNVGYATVLCWYHRSLHTPCIKHACKVSSKQSLREFH